MSWASLNWAVGMEKKRRENPDFWEGEGKEFIVVGRRDRLEFWANTEQTGDGDIP
jgi:hypothetical protein